MAGSTLVGVATSEEVVIVATETASGMETTPSLTPDSMVMVTSDTPPLSLAGLDTLSFDFKFSRRISRLSRGGSMSGKSVLSEDDRTRRNGLSLGLDF